MPMQEEYWIGSLTMHHAAIANDLLVAFGVVTIVVGVVVVVVGVGVVRTGTVVDNAVVVLIVIVIVVVVVDVVVVVVVIVLIVVGAVGRVVVVVGGVVGIAIDNAVVVLIVIVVLRRSDLFPGKATSRTAANATKAPMTNSVTDSNLKVFDFIVKARTMREGLRSLSFMLFSSRDDGTGGSRATGTSTAEVNGLEVNPKSGASGLIPIDIYVRMLRVKILLLQT